MVFVAILATFLTCIFGVDLYYVHSINYTVPNVYHLMITAVFAIVLLQYVQRKKAPATTLQMLAPGLVAYVFYAIGNLFFTSLRGDVLANTTPWIYVYMHWIDCILVGYLIWATLKLVRKNKEAFNPIINELTIVSTIAVIAFLSIEIKHIYLLSFFEKGNSEMLKTQFDKAGLSVIWGLCSFALIWLGMKHRQKTMRVTALVIFGIVLVKLFLIDLSGINAGGKILAFILLGVLLLVVSFMYQKLKKLIFDDPNE